MIPCTGPTDSTSCPINSVCADVANKTVVDSTVFFTIQYFRDDNCSSLMSTDLLARPYFCLLENSNKTFQTIFFQTYSVNGTAYAFQTYYPAAAPPCSGFNYSNTQGQPLGTCVSLVPGVSAILSQNPPTSSSVFKKVFDWQYKDLSSGLSCRTQAQTGTDVKAFVDMLGFRPQVERHVCFFFCCFERNPRKKRFLLRLHTCATLRIFRAQTGQTG